MGRKILLRVVFIGLLIASTQKLEAQWIQCRGLENSPVTAFAATGNNLVAGSYSTSYSQAYVFVSTDSGSSWTLQIAFHVNNKLPGNNLYIYPSVTFLADGNNLLAGIEGGFTGNVFLSTNNGTSWAEKDTSFIENVNSLATIAGNLFAGTNRGVFRSTDKGSSWNKPDTEMSYQVTRLAVLGTNLFAGTSSKGVYVSTSEATNWSAANSGLTNTHIYGLAVDGTHIFVGAFQFPGDSTGGVFISSDNGSSWRMTDSGLTRHTVNYLTANGATLFVGTNSGVFASSNAGANWTDISVGAPVESLPIIALAVIDSYLFAGTSDNGAWRYPLSQVGTGVKSSPQGAPSNFTLEQNFPNPFNPTTVIKYQLPAFGFVSLEVFDLLGKKIRTLVGERQDGGEHSVIFNADGLSSGVYFYKITDGRFVATKKLAVIK